jgi:hypothetical protein
MRRVWREHNPSVSAGITREGASNGEQKKVFGRRPGSILGSRRERAIAEYKVVLALIGAGGRGSALGANLAVLENTEFKSVCEVNDQRGAQIIDKITSIRGKRP